MHYGHSDIAEAVNWLLTEDIEAVDAMASGREFHFVIVRGANDFLYSVVLQSGTQNLCCVTVPLTVLSFNKRSSLSGDTATCSLRILYRKAMQVADRSALLQVFELQFLQQHRHTDILMILTQTLTVTLTLTVTSNHNCEVSGPFR